MTKITGTGIFPSFGAPKTIDEREDGRLHPTSGGCDAAFLQTGFLPALASVMCEHSHEPPAVQAFAMDVVEASPEDAQTCSAGSSQSISTGGSSTRDPQSADSFLTLETDSQTVVNLQAAMNGSLDNSSSIPAIDPELLADHGSVAKAMDMLAPQAETVLEGKPAPQSQLPGSSSLSAAQSSNVPVQEGKNQQMFGERLQHLQGELVDAFVVPGSPMRLMDAPPIEWSGRATQNAHSTPGEGGQNVQLNVDGHTVPSPVEPGAQHLSTKTSQDQGLRSSGGPFSVVSTSQENQQSVDRRLFTPALSFVPGHAPDETNKSTEPVFSRRAVPALPEPSLQLLSAETTSNQEMTSPGEFIPPRYPNQQSVGRSALIPALPFERTSEGGETTQNAGPISTGDVAPKVVTPEQQRASILAGLDQEVVTSGEPISMRNVSRKNQDPAQRTILTPTLSSISASAMMGNGERALLFQLSKDMSSRTVRPGKTDRPIFSNADGSNATVESGGLADNAQPVESHQDMPSAMSTSSARPIVDQPVDLRPSSTMSTAANNQVAAEGSGMATPGASDPQIKSSGDPGAERSSKQSLPRMAEVAESAGGLNTGEARTQRHNQADSGSSSEKPDDAQRALDFTVADNTRVSIESQNGQHGWMKEYLQSSTQPSGNLMNSHLARSGTAQQNSGLDAQAIFNVVADNVTNAITHELAQRVRDGISELRFHLRPESLGEMSLKVRLDDDKVTAQIHVTNPEVKAALEASVPLLRDALASRGIEVQHIDIFAAGESSPREFRGGQELRQKTSAKRRENDVAEERYKGTRRMGYNTIEVTM
jgi:flagellar hook-length control protein FliK